MRINVDLIWVLELFRTTLSPKINVPSRVLVGINVGDEKLLSWAKGWGVIWLMALHHLAALLGGICCASSWEPSLENVSKRLEGGGVDEGACCWRGDHVGFVGSWGHSYLSLFNIPYSMMKMSEKVKRGGWRGVLLKGGDYVGLVGSWGHSYLPFYLSLRFRTIGWKDLKSYWGAFTEIWEGFGLLGRVRKIWWSGVLCL